MIRGLLFVIPMNQKFKQKLFWLEAKVSRKSETRACLSVAWEWKIWKKKQFF